MVNGLSDVHTTDNYCTKNHKYGISVTTASMRDIHWPRFSTARYSAPKIFEPREQPSCAHASPNHSEY